ncbi:hypothetical protein DFP73DRAFT_558245, partial [Morchella snyderi]
YLSFFLSFFLSLLSPPPTSQNPTGPLAEREHNRTACSVPGAKWGEFAGIRNTEGVLCDGDPLRPVQSLVLPPTLKFHHRRSISCGHIYQVSHVEGTYILRCCTLRHTWKAGMVRRWAHRDVVETIGRVMGCHSVLGMVAGGWIFRGRCLRRGLGGLRSGLLVNISVFSQIIPNYLYMSLS